MVAQSRICAILPFVVNLPIIRFVKDQKYYIFRRTAKMKPTAGKDLSKIFIAISLLYAVTLVFCLHGCGTKRPTGQLQCSTEEDCPEGEICIDGVCSPPPQLIECSTNDQCTADSICIDGICQTVGQPVECTEGLNPIIDVNPQELDFGFVPVNQTGERKFHIRNIGTCQLNLLDIAISPDTTDEFKCPSCSPGYFPFTISPWSDISVTVYYMPTDAGPDEGLISVVSDDPELPHVWIKLKSQYKGTPEITIEPMQLDFGYVPVGDLSTLTVQIRNDGSGNASLDILQINIDPLTSVDYRIETSESIPAAIAPGDSINVNLIYEPQAPEEDEVMLLIASSDDDEPIVSIPVYGTSLVPAEIQVEPTSIDFGDVPIGEISIQNVTISNLGGVDLRVGLRLSEDSSTDFSYYPTSLGAIGGGGRSNLMVYFTPTQQGTATGQIILSSNDSSQPEIIVQLTANGIPSAGSDVLKVEMTFENGDDGMIDQDFRNVDLHYESPYGQDCSKDSPNPNWGVFGHPEWMGFGVKEDPERIIHIDAGMQDGDYLVWIEYVEDCEDVPVEWLAQLLGLTLEALIRGLTEGLLDFEGLGDLIASICFGRSSTDVTVKVFINGTLEAERNVTLSSKGDMRDVVTIERRNGFFRIP
jgi:hypothetical protein